MHETYLDLLTSLPHLGVELTVEAVTALAVYPALRRLRARFIRDTHAHIDAAHGIRHGCPTNPTGVTYVIPDSSHVRVLEGVR